MNANTMIADLHGDARDSRLDQLITLAREVNAEFELIHAEMSGILSRQTLPLAA